MLNFSLATIPNVDDGVNTTALQITLVQNDLDIAGVISFFGLGTISAANLVTGWALDIGNVASSVAAITSTVVCLQTLQPSDNNRGDFEDGNPALGITPALNAAGACNTPIAIPEINCTSRNSIAFPEMQFYFQKCNCISRNTVTFPEMQMFFQKYSVSIFLELMFLDQT